MIPNKPNDYFSYKKSKMQASTLKEEKKSISKLNFIIQLFIATFIIIFIVFVFSIMRYSQKIDIEYTKGDMINNESELATYDQDDEKQKIDRRLILIQQEEDAPSEAKILTNEKKVQDIIDPEIIENNKKIDKKIDNKIQKEQSKVENTNNITEQEDKPTLKSILDDMKTSSTSIKTQQETSKNDNVIIMSKVLVGRYPSLEEAQTKQQDIKSQSPSLSPYVKKVGNVYTIQMGSYQDINVAKSQAQRLKAKGYDVWIYQQ